MVSPSVVVLIPESTRKRPGGSIERLTEDAIEAALPVPVRDKLNALRGEILAKAPRGAVVPDRLLPAYQRFDGNMYRNIPSEAWDGRTADVEVLIASALRGLLASRDRVPAYRLSMAESTPPFGKLNRWWHDRGLPEILAAYLRSVKPKVFVDLLSLEYRESVAGYEDDLAGIEVRPIDFPGMGRGSQPLRGEKVAEILRTGKP